MTTPYGIGVDEQVALEDGGSAVLSGSVTVTAAEPGFVRVEIAPGSPVVTLRVIDAIELCDGDLIAAGSQWLRFQAGASPVDAPRLHLLDEAGAVMLSFGLHGPSLSIGRTSGDVVLGRDGQLSRLHLRVLRRPEGVFLQDLDSSNGTWTVVRPGELLPAGSVVAVGERLYQLGMPAAPVMVEASEDDLTWPIELAAA
ncbi:FHA domain-containing protein [Paraliomyxa miuraensis]|uniref:FHA domain-containing protein n=1 Tax=Paraliomyxa miuraensis TaxID=376150 RepID=UPI002258ECC9|nr:FHA domain-containing protein [Paraliomyxa miuraensis]MCX4242869.1 FHA domain-containing protein [Paraliomyxa miuraensis]